MNRGGVDFYTNPHVNLKAVKVPVMVVQNSNDPWTKMDTVNAYYEAIQSEKEMVWLDLEKKRAAAYDHVGKESKIYLDFLNKYL